MLLLILFQTARSEEIKLESLDEGPGLLPYKLGPMRLTTQYHTFIQYVQLNRIEEKIESLKTHLINYQDRMTNDTYSLYEIQTNHLLNKLDSVLSQLKSLEPSRAKRGLVDGLGSIIKTISGNLDYTDALRYNEAIKTLQNNQGKIVTEFNNHISLGKEWMTKHNKILEKILENQSKINSTIETIVNKDAYKNLSLIKYAKVAQLFVLISYNIEELSQELLRIENNLAFVRASSTHHSMIDIDVLGLMIKKLQNIYGTKQIIELEFREYYNIIKPASYYTKNQIVFIFKFPIISTNIYDLYRLSIVPNKNSQSLIPPYPFIATNEKAFVYIETECPKLSSWFLCEKGIDHQVRTKPDCIHGLIIKQILQESCQFTTITLAREAMEKLDDKHYVLSFPKDTRTQLSCNQQDYTSLRGSYLATIPIGCHIRTEDLTIANDNDEIKGQALKLSKIPYDVKIQTIMSPHLNLNTVDLQGLHRIQDRMMIQDPLQIKDGQSNVLYHTTVPFYIIVTGAAILLIFWILYRNPLKCSQEIEKDQPTSTKQEEISDPGSMPATFSLNVLK